ncbi:protein of unknown function [Denitratisoma oestradiolicum]|uniref:Uncharacterized protein n=1 Tax=Denitratisoma oestradiolicum TaxID=311182 RepID=A0A6S6YEN2_9PROT|nr:protein of unknown function [Denitratisoma oestradiolicum]
MAALSFARVESRGLIMPDSIRAIVTKATPEFLAKSGCVQLSAARAARMAEIIRVSCEKTIFILLWTLIMSLNDFSLSENRLCLSPFCLPKCLKPYFVLWGKQRSITTMRVAKV